MIENTRFLISDDITNSNSLKTTDKSINIVFSTITRIFKSILGLKKWLDVGIKSYKKHIILIDNLAPTKRKK